jgi:hypothetical protein
MLKQQQLDELYALYGFKKDKETDVAVVYLFSEGYFYNAEIFSKKNEKNILDELVRTYSDVGYAVRIVNYSNIEETHEKLFEGFFRTKESNEKLLKEYYAFCDSQEKKLGNNKYTYIASDFYFDNKLKQDNIIETLTNKFLQDTNEANLIILEAPAGFGKTCTSYEVINRLSRECKKQVPIIAELSKNRKAGIFQYVLLSEIDRKFSTLSSYLVRTEIKNGRIPLIIDGFDELLSKSIVDENIENEEIQTMLDTIAALLTDDSRAKILLTSRKSSIFTGDIFYQWVDTRLSNCNIMRIQLCELR